MFANANEWVLGHGYAAILKGVHRNTVENHARFHPVEFTGFTLALTEGIVGGYQCCSSLRQSKEIQKLCLIF